MKGDWSMIVILPIALVFIALWVILPGFFSQFIGVWGAGLGATLAVIALCILILDNDQTRQEQRSLKEKVRRLEEHTGLDPKA
jgi:hypothetical protein